MKRANICRILGNYSFHRNYASYACRADGACPVLADSFSKLGCEFYQSSGSMANHKFGFLGGRAVRTASADCWMDNQTCTGALSAYDG